MSKLITSIGEILVDWTCLDKTLDLNKANQFIKLPGGAPANVAVGLAKLGYPVAFIGGFAEDIFGDWLKEKLVELGVDISNSQTIKNSNTRCAYVLTDENGNRIFKGFSRNLCADSLLNYEEINIQAINDSEIFYFGSLLQACKNSRETIKNILENIKGANCTKVYDPNLRLFLWKSLEDAVQVIRETINYVDILKLSDDEINLIAGKEDKIEVLAEQIMGKYPNLKLLLVTSGPDGSYFINKNGSGYVKPFKVDSVEMTGAGDGFVAGVLGGLYDLLQKNKKIENLSSDEIKNVMTRANAIGALATTKPGAMSALPTKEELETFLTSRV